MINKVVTKEFFKPDWRRITALIFLFLINFCLIETRHPIAVLHAGSEQHLIGVYGWAEYYGIPLPFYTELNPLLLAIDIFLWYLLSCLIVRIYDSYFA